MKDRLTRAEGFFSLGMYGDAWEELESLAPIDRVEPLALEIKLRILTALERFELGEHVAGVLASSAIEPERCRETVARFHVASARALTRAGDIPRARISIRAACDVWPKIRAEVIDDKSLEPSLWTEGEP